MKKLLLFVLALFVGLLILGSIILANRTPEQIAADAARAEADASRREAERAIGDAQEAALAKEAVDQQEADRAARRAQKILKEIVDPARNTLELAYIQLVKDESASHISCREAEFSNRFFIRCGVAYGSPDTANNGVWEAAESNGQLVLYAMNGKALRALDKIGESAEFQKGHSRPPVDTVALSEKFE